MPLNLIFTYLKVVYYDRLTAKVFILNDFMYFYKAQNNFNSASCSIIISFLIINPHNEVRIFLLCLRPCHTLPDSANGRVTDSKILCPFVSVRMRFLSVPRAVNAFRVR